MVSLAVNTDWKNRFSKFALSSGSVTKRWPSRRKSEERFCFVVVFTNDQNRFGLLWSESQFRGV